MTENRLLRTAQISPGLRHKAASWFRFQGRTRLLYQTVSDFTLHASAQLHWETHSDALLLLTPYRGLSLNRVMAYRLSVNYCLLSVFFSTLNISAFLPEKVQQPHVCSMFFLINYESYPLRCVVSKALLSCRSTNQLKIWLVPPAATSPLPSTGFLKTLQNKIHLRKLRSTSSIVFFLFFLCCDVAFPS